jgi:hypothetical protein
MVKRILFKTISAILEIVKGEIDTIKERFRNDNSHS